MRTLELLLALEVMVTLSDPDIRSPLPLDCLQIKLPIVSLEQLRMICDPTRTVTDGVMVTTGVGSVTIASVGVVVSGGVVSEGRMVGVVVDKQKWQQILL